MENIHSQKKTKNVVVSLENHQRLGKLGDASETYNDVISRLIKNASASKGSNENK